MRRSQPRATSGSSVSTKSASGIAIEPEHLGLSLTPAASQALPSAVRAPSPSDGAAMAPGMPPEEHPVLPAGAGLREATERFQRQWIEQALQRHGGAMAAAAREAGMDRSNFQRLVKRLGVKT